MDYIKFLSKKITKFLYEIKWVALILVLLLLNGCAIAEKASEPPSAAVPPPKTGPKINPPMVIVLVYVLSAFLLVCLFFFSFHRYAEYQHVLAAITENGSERSFGKPMVARGIDPTVVASFTTFTYSTVKEIMIGKQALECAVCLNEFQDHEALRLLPKCNHVFHRDCIDEWLGLHITCPVCRASLVPKPCQLDHRIESCCGPNEPTKGHVTIQLPELKHDLPPTRKISRAHSMAHSVVELRAESVERYTLRLPQEMRGIMNNMATNTLHSPNVAFLVGSSSKHVNIRTNPMDHLKFSSNEIIEFLYEIKWAGLIFVLLLANGCAAAETTNEPPSVSVPSQKRGPKIHPAMVILLVCLLSALLLICLFFYSFHRCAEHQLALAAAIENGGERISRRPVATRGLDPTVVASFTSFTYSSVKDIMTGKQALECAVCLNEFRDHEALRLLPECSHVFHRDCIDEWLGLHITCPVCRASLVLKPCQVDHKIESYYGPNEPTKGHVTIQLSELKHDLPPTRKISHTHSMAELHVENVERYTLRLPEEMRDVINNMTTNTLPSPNVAISVGRSTKFASLRSASGNTSETSNEMIIESFMIEFGFIIMVSTGELLSVSQSSFLLPQYRPRVRTQGQNCLSCYKVRTTSSTNTTTRLPYRPLDIKQHSRNRFSSVVRFSVVPEKVPTNLSVDFGEGNEVQTDNIGGGGGDVGGRGGGGGGGDNNWGGSGGGDGEGASDDSEKEPEKMAMSMSQKLTLGYAALVGFGGLMGYLKSGSQKSLISGGVSAALLYYVYTQLPVNPVYASCIGLGLSAALLGVMGSRFKKSGKVFPAGVVSVVSLVMTGGYLHVWRSVDLGAYGYNMLNSTE
ncbi:hypothetical protein OSB04_005738 [Centaurea solstitialis]|uniref:RING-type E3 ubiquitin transferase n=1 Tax=Centaurea solstitialis TaxID=347529 RepID=A0AA38TGM0_9ASTR|nr:hypothetical protein OSB04_005738 [Centaurea solstitialis]